MLRKKDIHLKNLLSRVKVKRFFDNGAFHGLNSGIRKNTTKITCECGSGVAYWRSKFFKTLLGISVLIDTLKEMKNELQLHSSAQYIFKEMEKVLKLIRNWITN